MSVQGKTALVTGSTSGIGLGIASVLAAAGARVILNGFGDVEAAKAQVARLGAPPVSRRRSRRCGPDSGHDGLCRTRVRRRGHSDKQRRHSACGAAGSVPGGEMERHPRHQPVGGVPHLPIGAAGDARAQLGRIINVASVHGLVASKDKSAYVAAKHGVVGLTKTLALETARTPVTCNAICPGWVLTPLVQQQIDKRIAAGTDPQRARDELLAEKQPSQAFVTPEQLGELALFLCSDAAAQVRGAAWNMDGGWLAQ